MNRKVLVLMCLLGAGAAPAATMQGVACTNGGSTFKLVPVTSAVTMEVSATNSGQGLLCQLLTKTLSTWFVRVSADGGTTYSFVTVASVLGTAPPTKPTPPAPPPKPTTSTFTVTWSPSTTDRTGATLTVPVTYNLYRGSTVSTVTLYKSSVTSPFLDPAIPLGTVECYAVTAIDTYGESAVPTALCATSAGLVIPTSPNSLKVTSP